MPHRSKRQNFAVLILLAVFLVYFGIIFYFAFPFKSIIGSDVQKQDVRILHSLVSIQKSTIDTLMQKVISISTIKSLYEFKNVPDEKKQKQQESSPIRLTTAREQDCESRYGSPIVSEWQSTEEIWCDSLKTDLIKSSLKCYPFQQKHRKEQGKGQDVFCVAENFVIDFSLVSSSP